MSDAITAIVDDVKVMECGCNGQCSGKRECPYCGHWLRKSLSFELLSPVNYCPKCAYPSTRDGALVS